MEENRTLAEANRRYRMHTTELKDRVEALGVSMVVYTPPLSHDMSHDKSHGKCMHHMTFVYRKRKR